MDQNVSKQQVSTLIEDAAYLQDEVEALKYVIDVVPYNEAPPEGRSISHMLLFIDHAQLSYFRPILREAVENPRPTHIKNFPHFEDSFEPDEDKTKDIQKMLSKLAKHRAGVINTLKNISLINWETIVYDGDRQILLFDFAKRMIRSDRKQLNKIADLVSVFNSQRETQRDIKKRQKARNPQTENNS